MATYPRDDAHQRILKITNSKSITQAMLESIAIRAMELAHENKQVTGDKNNFYITLEQLEAIIKAFEG